MVEETVTGSISESCPPKSPKTVRYHLVINLVKVIITLKLLPINKFNHLTSYFVYSIDKH